MEKTAFSTVVNGNWRAVLYHHLRKHWMMAVGMAVSLVAIVFMLVQSLMKIGDPAFDQALKLAMTGGAMIFIVSHEVIPETHRNGHQTPATIGLLVGFALMMVLDTMLG